jgi:hypothetical protein
MRSGWGRIAVLVVVVTGLTLSIRYREHINTDVLEQWVAELGVVGPVGFLFVYAIGVLFFFPGSILTLTGGAMFGPVLGTFINLTIRRVTMDRKKNWWKACQASERRGDTRMAFRRVCKASTFVPV